MRNRNCDYDEKQLIDRGRAYQTSFFVSLLTVFALFFITDCLEVPIERRTLFLLALWIPITVCFMLLITSDAYIGVHTPRGKTLAFFALYCLVGVVVTAVTLSQIASGSEALVRDGTLTSTVGYLVYGVCMVAVGVTYWVKQRDNRRKFGDEND